MVEIEEMTREDSLDYLKILKGLMEIPFSVGRKLLVDFLVGDYKNKSITKNALDELHNFDSLNWDKNKVLSKIGYLMTKGMIEEIPADYNKFIKVLRLTLRGQNEISKPTLNKKQEYDFGTSEISEDEESLFLKYKDFLEGYNDEQKKAIVSSAKKILIIAGAGSGKTTVLTKRIEFLVNKKNIKPEEILAITFTRKAKQEMINRLNKNQVEGANVHTFNSFCENFLRNNEAKVYGKKMRVMTYTDKILAVNFSINLLGYNEELLIDEYFSPIQRANKTRTKLQNIFLNDIFGLLEHFKTTNQKIYDFSREVPHDKKIIASKMYEIVKKVQEYIEMQGLRDYNDQLIDTVKFFKRMSEEIPYYKYILVDEYQDVNAIQVELLKLLSPENLFVVGDPRQSIFGWRGSDINFILNFNKEFLEAETIHLTKNYRSTKKIVELMNNSIKEMDLPNIEVGRKNEEEKTKKINLFSFGDEDEERKFVIEYLQKANESLDEIFVLSRTNRQVNELANLLKDLGIKYILKTDEVKSFTDKLDNHVTLATIHSIKGLEAKTVFVIGASEQNFPCKASDHPIIEMVKQENYNKEAEELRLFYVAISRAKENLFITHSGKRPTYFINEEMEKLLG